MVIFIASKLVFNYIMQIFCLVFAGFYTVWLLPAAIVGTLVFVSGIMTMGSNTPASVSSSCETFLKLDQPCVPQATAANSMLSVCVFLAFNLFPWKQLTKGALKAAAGMGVYAAKALNCKDRKQGMKIREKMKVWFCFLHSHWCSISYVHLC